MGTLCTYVYNIIAIYLDALFKCFHAYFPDKNSPQAHFPRTRCRFSTCSYVVHPSSSQMFLQAQEQAEVRGRKVWAVWGF